MKVIFTDMVKCMQEICNGVVNDNTSTAVGGKKQKTTNPISYFFQTTWHQYQ